MFVDRRQQLCEGTNSTAYRVSNPNYQLEAEGMKSNWNELIWRSGLRGSELLLALALADHADHNGKSFPGITKLCDQTKLCKRQVKRAVRSLEKKNLLEVVANQKGGRGRSSVFQLKRSAQLTPLNEQTDICDDTHSEQNNDRGTPHSEQNNDIPTPLSEQNNDIPTPLFVKKGDISRTPPTPPYKDNLLNTEEEEGAADATPRRRRDLRPDLDDNAWVRSLEAAEENRGISVHALFLRMEDYCRKTGKVPTRHRFLSWLEKDRADAPISQRLTMPPIAEEREYVPDPPCWICGREICLLIHREEVDAINAGELTVEQARSQYAAKQAGGKGESFGKTGHM